MKGERAATDLLREGVAMLDHIERLIIEEKIACDFTRCGTVRARCGPVVTTPWRVTSTFRRLAEVEFSIVPASEQSRDRARSVTRSLTDGRQPTRPLPRGL